MAFKQRESDLDKALRAHSDEVHGSRELDRSDERLGRGEGPQHCGVDATQNSYGDYDCAGSCGSRGIA